MLGLVAYMAASAQAMYVFPIKGTVNVRTAPSTSASKAGSLTTSDLVPCIDELDGWYKIDFNGKEAYVSQSVATTCEAIIPEEMFGKDLVSSKPWDKIRHQGLIRIDRIDNSDRALITMEWMRINLPAEATTYLADIKDGRIVATHACGMYVDLERPLPEILEESVTLDKPIPVGFDEFNNTIYFYGAEFSEYE